MPKSSNNNTTLNFPEYALEPSVTTPPISFQKIGRSENCGQIIGTVIVFAAERQASKIGPGVCYLVQPMADGACTATPARR